MYLIVFFFKQKTAYEMRISDWSSDVCSSDLDGISQLLVSIKFQFELASHVLEKGQENGLGFLKNATDRLGEAIGAIRSISHDLRSSLLDTLGLTAAIGQLAAEFQQRSGLEVSYKSNEFDCRLENGAPVSLFRIAQEALTNIERHAGAKSVGITLFGSGESLRSEEHTSELQSLMRSSYAVFCFKKKQHQN